MKNIILGLALLVLVGCAGQQFLRPQNDTINIGKMSYQEIINNYGEPRMYVRLTITRNKLLENYFARKNWNKNKKIH